MIVHYLCIAFGLYADSKIIGEMFYFVFFVTNYFALGFGFWLAMRHGEYLREHPLVMQTVNDGTTETMIEAVSSVPEDMDTKNSPLQETSVQPILAQSNNAITDQAELEGTQVRELEPIPATTMSAVEMLSAGIIEQVIGMAENASNDDLHNIVSQLQEIRGAISNADNHCYVFEDAESFLTRNDEKYVTTAICRPVVGRKK